MADESDEDVFDNWEDMVDSQALDKRLMKIKSPQSLLNTEDNCEESGSRSQSLYTTVILQDDMARTQYVPPDPPVKILKRPANASKTEGLLLVNGEKLTKQPIKTLQQREAEYAEARLRILGAAKSEEEIAEEKLGKLALTATTVTETPKSSAATCSAVGAVTGEPVPLIRQPRGPDGTKGFSAVR